jgi:hypothetical protein
MSTPAWKDISHPLDIDNLNHNSNRPGHDRS